MKAAGGLDLAPGIREPRAVSTPQAGIFALGTASHAYLEFDLASGGDGRELVGTIASLREPRTTMGGVNLVAGFRPELWKKVVTPRRSRRAELTVRRELR